ncbi:MAG TPA: hypothetical protein VMQ56_14675 [Terracidiphilus sp.]|nr:hypothetical protein [Terracidiphilus sp.]
MDFYLYHNSANLSVRFENKSAQQSVFLVENFVDYSPRLPAKIPISPLASYDFFLLSDLNRYLSTANSGPTLPRKRLTHEPVSASRL